MFRANIRSVVVNDAAIVEARRRLWQDLRLVTEIAAPPRSLPR